MALIGKIRSNPLIVLLFIGGGIALFVISDAMNSGTQGPIGPAEAIMAEVGEFEIERNEFERTLSVAGNNNADAYQNRSSLYNYYVSEGLIRNETGPLGLRVTSNELDELTYGPRYSPVIRQSYGNRQTGQVNAQILNNVRSRIEGGTIQEAIEAGELPSNFVDIWRYQNRQVRTQRLQEKLANLVSKSLYTPSWLAQDHADNLIAGRRAAVVRIPFDELDNDEVEVSEADLEAYIEDNRSLYDNEEETRRLSYVSFEVAPTDADSAAVRATLRDIAQEWQQITSPREDSLFALSVSGNYSGAYVTEDDLPTAAAGAVMNRVSPGEVYGPFLEGNLMVLVKLIDRRELADSVDIQRILRPAAGVPGQATEAERLIDSLQTVLDENPERFGELAGEFNQDPRTAATGGVQRNVTPNQLPASLNQLAFVSGEVGEIYKVTTPQGIELVKILSRSDDRTQRIKVAYATEPMVPSSETEEAVRARAEEFLVGKSDLEAMKAAAREAGLSVETTRPLDIGAFRIEGLGSGQDVRDIVCWAFGTDEGDVSGFVYTFTDPQFFYENRYAVVGLEQILPEGLAPVAAIREDIEPLVRNRKKGELLAERLAATNDLSSAAREYRTDIDTLNSVNLASSTLGAGIGNEPAVVAAITETSTGQVSQPVIGNNGVYLVEPLSDASTGSSGNIPMARQQLNSADRGQVARNLLPALRANADIEDQRYVTECNR